MVKRLWAPALAAVFCMLWVSLTASAQSADSAEHWLQRWNREEGREVPLTSEDVLFRPAPGDSPFGRFLAVGFRQSHGTYPFGRLVIGGEVYSPLDGLAELLTRAGYADADEQRQKELFVTALQETYGILGAVPYLGPAASLPSHRDTGTPRPEAPRSQFSVDGTLRTVIWFVEEPGDRNGAEWRQVLYLVAPDGSEVRARSLFSARPTDDRLPGFPDFP